MIVFLLWSVHFHVSETPEGIRYLDSHRIGAVTWSVLFFVSLSGAQTAPPNTQILDRPAIHGLECIFRNTIGIIQIFKVFGTVVAWFCRRDLHILRLQNAACSRSVGEAQRGQTHRYMD